MVSGRSGLYNHSCQRVTDECPQNQIYNPLRSGFLFTGLLLFLFRVLCFRQCEGSAKNSDPENSPSVHPAGGRAVSAGHETAGPCSVSGNIQEKTNMGQKCN